MTLKQILAQLKTKGIRACIFEIGDFPRVYTNVDADEIPDAVGNCVGQLAVWMADALKEPENSSKYLSMILREIEKSANQVVMDDQILRDISPGEKVSSEQARDILRKIISKR